LFRRVAVKKVLLKVLPGLFVLLMTVFGMSGNARAEMSAGISLGNEGVDSFYLAMSDYNRVPERVLIGVRDRGIPDEQVPVVMFLAAHAQVAPEVVAKMRRRHMSWMEIAEHFRIGVDVFYVPLTGNLTGTVYERPYRYFKQDRRHWNRMRLTDSDIVNLVNLKFVSDYHKYRPDDVIRFRTSGRNFVDVHNDIRMEREKREGRDHRGNGYDKRDDRRGHDDKNWNGRDDRNNGRDDRNSGRYDRNSGRDDRNSGRDDRNSGRDDRNNDGNDRNNGYNDRHDDKGDVHGDNSNGNGTGVSMTIANGNTGDKSGGNTKGGNNGNDVSNSGSGNGNNGQGSNSGNDFNNKGTGNGNGNNGHNSENSGSDVNNKGTDKGNKGHNSGNTGNDSGNK
jgi:hypothetical protein